MHRRAPKLLEDIRDAATFIGEVTAGRTLVDYKFDRLLRQGVERNFEIIGEAVKRLAAVDGRTADELGDYRRIIAFRNVLIHGYDLLDHELVWQTIGEQLVTLRRSVEGLLHRHSRLPRGLYVLTPELEDDRLEDSVRAAIRGGATTVQYRNKTLDAARRLQQAIRLRAACHEAGATFIVNDSLDLARESEADGIHLGRDDADPESARAILGSQALIGVSCYDSLERALETREIADYCAFGSVFVSRVKPAAVRAPLELFRQAREAGLHAVAIGGIDAENAGEVARAGAAAVAVITSVFGDADGEGVDTGATEENARRIARAVEAGRMR